MKFKLILGTYQLCVLSEIFPKWLVEVLKTDKLKQFDY